MRDYVNIPNAIYVRLCKKCGTRPIIAIASETGYVVKCPYNHYATLPGLIDLDDWNAHNNVTTVEHQPASIMSWYS